MNGFKASAALGLVIQQGSAVLQVKVFSLHWASLGVLCYLCPRASAPPYRLYIVLMALSGQEIRRGHNASQPGFPQCQRPSPLLLSLLCSPPVACLRRSPQCTRR